MIIGYHESTANGFLGLGQQALEAGANTFAFFTRNPRGGSTKEIDPSDAASLVSFIKKNTFGSPVAHAPYTMNPCSSNPSLREYALDMMVDDFKRLEYTPGCFYNFHPGSHTGQGTDIGIDLTAKLISECFKVSLQNECHSVLLIETMSGKGSEIGKTFEEVHQIIERAEVYYGQELSSYLGVCLDTCHIWDGGYDIVNNLDGVISDFDKIIGLNRLHAVHLNDSMNDCGSHKDRHQKIGQGFIGLDALKRVVSHPSLCNLPFILETPNDFEGYKKEIELLRS